VLTAVPPPTPRALLPLLGAIVLFGAAWPITKVAIVAGAGPAWFALGRAGLSSVGSAVLLLALGRMRRPGRADLPALLAVGVFQLAGFFALGHLAVALVPAGTTAVLSNATTVWIVPLSLLFLHEHIPARRWAATIVSVLGVIVLAGPWAIDWSRPGIVLGHVLLLGAALSWSIAMVALRRWPPRLTMLQMLPWAFAIATLILLPLALSRPVGHWTASGWTALVLIGAVAGPGGTWCVMRATQVLPVVVASIGFLGAPAVGLLLAVLWLGETLTWGLGLGSVLILLGVAVAAWPKRA